MNCRLCGHPLNNKFTVSRFTPGFDIFECPHCGFEQQNISPGDAYRFYDEAYYTGKKEFSYLDERRNEEACRIVWKARMNKLRKRDKSHTSKSFLDVGCSFGGLMSVAEDYGYAAYGAEVSSYSGRYACERFGDNRVFTGNIETINLPPDKFTVVTMIEVIEHIYQPRTALENIYRSMAEGGLILIQTADMSGRQALTEGSGYHYYLPGHISYFNRANLQNLLRETGFRKTKYIGGVEFGLIPKLRKSRRDFKNWKDYSRWLRIASYHWKSKITVGNTHLTSSMVVMAWK